jgi:hypothetical protein
VLEARRTSRTPGEPVRKGQLSIRWDSGSTLAMLLHDGDQVRLITPAPGRTAPPAPPASTPDQEGGELA